MDETHPGAEDQGMTQVLLKSSNEASVRLDAVDV